MGNEGVEVGGSDDGEGVAVVGGGEADEETEDGCFVDVCHLNRLGVVDDVRIEEVNGIGVTFRHHINYYL